MFSFPGDKRSPRLHVWPTRMKLVLMAGFSVSPLQEAGRDPCAATNTLVIPLEAHETAIIVQSTHHNVVFIKAGRRPLVAAVPCFIQTVVCPASLLQLVPVICTLSRIGTEH
jgi:hypothetical protein